jgi:beta-lactamase regulating signal transducer with metallopeptidase domain
MNFELSIMIKTTVVLAFGWIAATLLRRASSSTRHAIWVIALFNALLLPLGTRILPSLTVPILHEQEVVTTETNTASIETTSAASPFAPRVHTPSSAAKTNGHVPAATFTPERIVTAVWAAGFLLMLLRLVRATWSVRRLARHSTIIEAEDWNDLRNRLQRELGVSRTVEIRTAGQMPPMTWGIYRHTILLQNPH